MDQMATKDASVTATQRPTPDHLKHLLALARPPTDKEVEDKKIRLAEKLERFEYIGNLSGCFLDVLVSRNKKISKMIRCSSEVNLRRVIRRSQTDVDLAMRKAAAQQHASKTLKRRLAIIDQFCAVMDTAETDGQDIVIVGRNENELKIKELPNYQELLKGKKTAMWDTKEVVLSCTCMRPYKPPQNIGFT
eukprot:GEMP01032350.1.p1 GENE.GEMP01032350.1~~GEMP01032350.1.p1  ORF type:complete len:191 (+),score=39.77 GEMP01032350.1:39-611(+)